MTTVEAFERAVDRLQRFFADSKGEHLWTERDAEYELGFYLRQELDRDGSGLRIHYGVPISTAGYAWWGSKGYPKVASQIEQARSEIGGRSGKRIDLIVYDDNDKTDRLPIFPLVAEVKYPWLYGGSMKDKSFVKWFEQDREKLTLLKKHGLADTVCFVMLDEKPRRFHVDILSQGWGVVKVYLVLIESGTLGNSRAS